MSHHKFHHYVLPHHKTHRKAHLLSEKALFAYLIFFLVLQFGFKIIGRTFPGVLGTTSAITKQEIIALTNEERQKNGLLFLKENSALDAAAEEKAKNMFSENYWAHVSPSGKSPWVWIQQAGYTYRFAGENLARSFSTSSAVVAAWMTSKQGHKENILNNKYQDIGIAVEDGVINGEKTTLVVQMFGTSTTAIAAIDNEGASTVTNKNSQIATNVPVETRAIAQVNSANTQVVPRPSFLSSFITVNSISITRTFGFSLISFLLALAVVDLFVMARRNKLARLHLRHLPHVTFVIVAAVVLLGLSSGAIL